MTIRSAFQWPKVNKSGLFIALEGPDGCGKTTQSKALKQHLEQGGYQVILTREPGGTPLAEEIRKLLLSDSGINDPMTELLLLSAARRDHIENLIKPKLDQGFIVISDRFIGSTIAYQGALKGLDYQQIINIHNAATASFYPDITLVFTLSPEAAAGRMQNRSNHNHYDALSSGARGKIHDCYQSLDTILPQANVKFIDSSLPPKTVTAKMLEIITSYFI